MTMNDNEITLFRHKNTHCKDIDLFYNSIVSVLKTSGTNCIPMSNIVKNSSFRLIAGWNEYVKEHYSISQDALWW